MIGIFYFSINPFFIWHWGIVADIIGYLTPLQKFGEYKDVNPFIEVVFGIYLTVAVTP